MTWLEVSLAVSGELAEAVADLLARHAPGGVALEAEQPEPEGALSAGLVVLRAYLPQDGRLADRRRAIEEGLWHLGRIQPLPAPAFQTVAEQDWAEAWKAHYRPIAIGRRLLILPAWLPIPPGERQPLILDPGMAFGTGTHPSTQLCLAALEDYLQPGCSAVDLGCGSGILSIAAARLGAGRVLALDNDPLAVRVARENLERNGLADRVEIRLGSLPEALAENAASGTRLLLANILAPVLEAMLVEGLAGTVVPEGVVILSGILDHQAHHLVAACAECGLTVVETRADGDWRALVLKRRPAPGSGERDG